MEWFDLVFFAGVALWGMFIYGFAGFASGLFCIPILGLRLEADTFVPAFALCMLVINLRLVHSSRRHVQWSHISWWLLGAVIAAPAGAVLLDHVPTGVITFLVGTMALGVGLMYLSDIELPIPANRPTRVGIGALSGFLVAMSGAGGPPVVIDALARKWPKDAFRGSLMAYFMCIGTITICLWAWPESLGGKGYYTRNGSLALLYAAVAFLPMVLGTLGGAWLKSKVDESRFRRTVLILLIAVGVVGIGKGLMTSMSL